MVLCRTFKNIFLKNAAIWDTLRQVIKLENKFFGAFVQL